jgi:hypothetical protein
MATPMPILYRFPASRAGGSRDGKHENADCGENDWVDCSGEYAQTATRRDKEARGTRKTRKKNAGRAIPDAPNLPKDQEYRDPSPPQPAAKPVTSSLVFKKQEVTSTEKRPRPISVIARLVKEKKESDASSSSGTEIRPASRSKTSDGLEVTRQSDSKQVDIPLERKPSLVKGESPRDSRSAKSVQSKTRSSGGPQVLVKSSSTASSTSSRASVKPGDDSSAVARKNSNIGLARRH